MNFLSSRFAVACAAGALLWCSTAVGGVAHDPDLQWRTLRTPHFHIHFHDGLDALAARAAGIAERAHQRLSSTLQWSPTVPTDLVLTDEVDFANGFTTPLPGNHVELWVTPPSDGLDEFGAWLDALITHEYVHVLHLDAVDDTPAAWRKVFGRHPLLFPDLLQPDWVIEGIATYLEGDQASNTGRGQSSYFDMLMRMEVADGVKPLSQVNLPIDTWPAGTTRYLYGVEFMKFVADRYGEGALRNWIIRYRGNLIPFMINTNSRRVLNKSLTQLWDEFVSYLQQRHRPQIAKIEAAGERAGEALTLSGYASGHSLVAADGSVYYVRADGRQPLALVRLKPGAITPDTLAEVNPGARFDVNPQAGVLIAQSERVRNARVQFDLYRMPVDGGTPQRITFGGRYRQAVWSPRGDMIYAVRQELGTSSLRLLDASGAEREVLWQGNADEVLAAVAVNPQGTALVTSMWRRDEGWQLAEFDVAERRWRNYPQPDITPLDARYAPSGDAILYSADVAGVYDIWRIDRATGERRQLTRVVGGAFSPSADARGNLVYVGYQARGYDVYRLAADQVTVDLGAAAHVIQAQPATPVAVQNAATTYPVTDYTPATGVAPTWWSPLWALSDDLNLLGVTTGGTDPLRRHSYGLTAAYDFANAVPVGSLLYAYDGWTVVPQLGLSRDLSLHRDSNNTLVAVTTENALEAVLTWPFLKQRQQWLLHVGAIDERETVESTAPGVTFRPKKDNQMIGAALSFNSTRQLPLSISRGFGRDVSLVFENSDVGSSDYLGNVTVGDWREFFNPGGEHVIGVRGVFGWGEGDPQRFELGGALSTDELLSADAIALSSPFNRRDYALRGYPEGLSQLKGRRMELLSAEWHIPFRRIERTTMAPPVGIHQWFATLFTDAGAAWDQGNSPDDYYVGSGIEFKFDVALFYRARVGIIAGYAHGWDEQLGEDQFYFRLGSSF